METIREALEGNRTLAEQEEISTELEEIRSSIAFLRRRLDRLAKIHSLLKERHRSKLDSLSTRLSDIDMQQAELKGLARQLKGSKEKQTIIREEVASLDRRRKTLLKIMRQIATYRRVSNVQVEAIEEEREVLCQQIDDLEHVLKAVQQAEMGSKEMEIVARRTYAKKALLEEHLSDLTKRTIDLLFDFYVPARTGKRFKL